MDVRELVNVAVEEVCGGGLKPQRLPVRAQEQPVESRWSRGVGGGVKQDYRGRVVGVCVTSRDFLGG